MNTRHASMRLLALARDILSMEFDTEEAKKKYQQEHDVRPETKLEVKKSESPVSVQKPGVKKKKPENRMPIQRPEYHSGDYGSWISPEGEMLPVKGFQQHIPVLAEVFKQKEIRGKVKDYADAFKHGYVRVNNDPMNIQIRGSLTLEQKDSLVDLVGQYVENPENTMVVVEINGDRKLFHKDDEGLFRESFGAHDKIEDAIRNASMKTRRLPMELLKIARELVSARMIGDDPDGERQKIWDVLSDGAKKRETEEGGRGLVNMVRQMNYVETHKIGAFAELYPAVVKRILGLDRYNQIIEAFR